MAGRTEISRNCNQEMKTFRFYKFKKYKGDQHELQRHFSILVRG